MPVLSRVEAVLSSDIKKKLQEDPIKVALIDDGVNPGKMESWCLRHGNGWPDDEDTATYYQSTENHGTVMANLISHMCPYVHLYVAKLDKSTREDGKYGSVAEMAAQVIAPSQGHKFGKSCRADTAFRQAVDWAVNQKVDIISMSWTVEKTPNHAGVQNLQDKINKASGEKIILFCAAEDEAEYGKGNSLPANCGSNAIKRIGSCNKLGHPSDFVKEADKEYLFPGEGILQHITGDLKDKDRNGSSAATALASGLAAMILWCSVAVGEDKIYFRQDSRLINILDQLSKIGKFGFIDITRILDDLPATQNPLATVEEMVDKLNQILTWPSR